MKKTANTLLLTCLLFFSLGAQSPYLDQTFGVNGRFTHLFAPQSNSYLQCVAMLPGGNILAAGMTTANNKFLAAALRCLPDGTLDTTFADHGEWLSEDPLFQRILKIIVQPDGKILLSGSTFNLLKVVRLMPDGSYDGSFGIGGTSNVTAWLGAQSVVVNGMELLPDGQIVILGTRSLINDGFVVARLRENGTLDEGFGSSGVIKFSAENLNAAQIYDPILNVSAPNNKIFVGGDSFKNGKFENFLMQLDDTGQLDLEFGDNGLVYYPNSIFQAVRQVWLLPDHSIQMLGSAYSGHSKTALIKLKPDGTLDSTFAVNGIGTLSHNNTHSDPFSGALQTDSKVVVFGGSSGKGFLGRFNADGSPDLNFGINGTLGPETLFEIFYDGFVQTDGNIVAVSRFKDENEVNLCSILRYLGSHSVGTIQAAEPLGAARAYPNPVSGGLLQIAYELPEAAPVQIELLDMQGKQLSRLMYADRPSGHSEETLVLPPGLMPGHYLLNIRSSKGNRVVRVVVR